MTHSPKLENFLPPGFKVSNPRRKLYHIFDESDCYALWAAYSAGRPLLVRGQAGTGKSQMARAIAEQLGWAFVEEVIRGSTELSDLHWHFDAVGRLAEAQARAQPAGDVCKTGDDKLDPVNFLAPGAFWWAFNWESAERQYAKCAAHLRPEPEKPDSDSRQAQGWTPASGGVVLLLDEIDKAEPDLPNGLLETLGHYQFTAPYIDKPGRQNDRDNPIKAAPSRLLVVITTNEERELPKAFVRRCFVHTLAMEESAEPIDPKTAEPVDPKSDNKIEKRQHWLMERGRLHFGEAIAEPVYRQAAQLLWRDRSDNPHSQYPPGLAEYIDLLRALQALSHSEQIERLKNIAKYALKKELGK